MHHYAGALQTQMMNSLFSFDDRKGLIEMLAIVEQLFEIRTGLIEKI